MSEIRRDIAFPELKVALAKIEQSRRKCGERKRQSRELEERKGERKKKGADARQNNTSRNKIRKEERSVWERGRRHGRDQVAKRSAKCPLTHIKKTPHIKKIRMKILAALQHLLAGE